MNKYWLNFIHQMSMIYPHGLGYDLEDRKGIITLLKQIIEDVKRVSCNLKLLKGPLFYKDSFGYEIEWLSSIDSKLLYMEEIFNLDVELLHQDSESENVFVYIHHFFRRFHYILLQLKYSLVENTLCLEPFLFKGLNSPLRLEDASNTSLSLDPNCLISYAEDYEGSVINYSLYDKDLLPSDMISKNISSCLFSNYFSAIRNNQLDQNEEITTLYKDIVYEYRYNEDARSNFIKQNYKQIATRIINAEYSFEHQRAKSTNNVSHYFLRALNFDREFTDIWFLYIK